MSENSGTENGNGDTGDTGQAKKTPNVRRSNYALVGTVVVSVLVVGLALGMTKPEWQQYINFGFTTREINFPGDYFTLPNSSKVKVAGVEVGRIDSVERRDDGTAIYTVRVQPDVIDKVGSAPSANVRPTTLLGGIVYVDLLPGGDRTRPWEKAIPIERTRLPVELSPVIQAIQPDAVKGIPATINGLEGTLRAGGIEAVKRLGREAPAALGPGAGVINALTGQNPGTDLPAVVSGLQKTTAVLSRRDGQIEAILRDLRTTTTVFRETSRPVTQAIRDLPQALDTARSGLARLSVTLDKLEATAGPARPTVQELDRLLARLDPVLVKARPVVNDLRFALQETRPLVQALVPAAKDLRFVFQNLDPSLDRLRGPVTDALESGYEPDNPAGADTAQAVNDPLVSKDKYTKDVGRRHTDVPGRKADKLRDEIGPAIRGLNGSGGYFNDKGHAIAFNAGIGAGSLGGLDLPTLYSLIIAGGAGLPLPISGGSALPLQAPGLPVPQLPVPGGAALTGPAAPAAPAAPALPGGLLTGGNR